MRPKLIVILMEVGAAAVGKGLKKLMGKLASLAKKWDDPPARNGPKYADKSAGYCLCFNGRTLDKAFVVHEEEGIGRERFVQSPLQGEAPSITHEKLRDERTGDGHVGSRTSGTPPERVLADFTVNLLYWIR